MTDFTQTTVHAELSPQKERRLAPRSKMAEIIYMNMEAENGGILSDISVSGMGFQLASPMGTERAISFRLSAEGIENIEISAELVWLGDDRKRGGLRFGQLPEKVRARIHRWAGTPATPATRVPDPVVPVAAKSVTAGQQSIPGPAGHSLISEMNPYSLTRETPREGSTTFAASSLSLERLPNPMRANPGFRSALLSEPEAARRRTKSGGIALLALILILLAAGVFVYENKRQVGASIIYFGESLSGESAQQSADPAPPPVAPSLNNTAPGPPQFATTDVPESSASSAASQNTRVPGAATPAPQVGGAVQPVPPAHQPDSSAGTLSPDSKDQPTKTPAGAARPTFAPQPERATAPEKLRPRSSDESVREDDGHTELALAQQYLRGSSVPKDRDMAAHLLWVAVGEGNPQAELELADLYLRTDGVPEKNCAQARILLNASSNSGNLEAGQQLAKLRDYGCR